MSVSIWSTDKSELICREEPAAYSVGRPISTLRSNNQCRHKFAEIMLAADAEDASAAIFYYLKFCHFSEEVYQFFAVFPLSSPSAHSELCCP